jgi:hypothetical protein
MGNTWNRGTASTEEIQQHQRRHYIRTLHTVQQKSQQSGNPGKGMTPIYKNVTFAEIQEKSEKLPISENTNLIFLV